MRLRLAIVVGLIAISVPLLWRDRQPVDSPAARAYYIDCANGVDGAAGTDPDHPWRSLQQLSGTRIAAGSQILIRRGTTCSGMFAPLGSGVQGAPIRLSAYGEGPLPVIDAGGAPYVLRLVNQDYWEIDLLELRGGTLSGLSVSCDDSNVHSNFRLHNLVIHGLRGRAVTKRRGLLAIAPASTECTFSDIDIDGITAFDSTQWAGIVIDGGYPPNRLEELESRYERWRFRLSIPPARHASNVSIRNSVVHDVGGDGIVVFRAENARIESNLSWSAGMAERPNNNGQSPNAMWTLLCRNCTIRDNEAFLTDTPLVDGGAFDIDWGCENNTIEYNYAHDNAGYCFSIFGARELTTTGSVARYNICINNGRSPRMAKRQGDVFISTWEGGYLDGLEVYRNTFFWNPATGAPLFTIRDAHETARVSFRGSRLRRISQNLAISTDSAIGVIDPAIENSDNRWWSPGLPDAPVLDPLLRPVGETIVRAPSPFALGFDAFRTPLHPADPPFKGALLPADTPVPSAPNGSKVLRVFVDPQRSDSRRLVVLARSAAQQFGPLGLTIDIRLPLGASGNVPYDWHFSDLPHLFSEVDGSGVVMQVVDARGNALMSWRERPSPAAVDLALRWFVGTPLFSRPLILPGSRPVSAS